MFLIHQYNQKLYKNNKKNNRKGKDYFNIYIRVVSQLHNIIM